MRSLYGAVGERGRRWDGCIVVGLRIGKTLVWVVEDGGLRDFSLWNAEQGGDRCSAFPVSPLFLIMAAGFFCTVVLDARSPFLEVAEIRSLRSGRSFLMAEGGGEGARKGCGVGRGGQQGGENRERWSLLSWVWDDIRCLVEDWKSWPWDERCNEASPAHQGLVPPAFSFFGSTSYIYQGP